MPDNAPAQFAAQGDWLAAKLPAYIEQRHLQHRAGDSLAIVRHGVCQIIVAKTFGGALVDDVRRSSNKLPAR